jgi:hypothetical protein
MIIIVVVIIKYIISVPGRFIIFAFRLLIFVVWLGGVCRVVCFGLVTVTGGYVYILVLALGSK